MNIGDLLFSGKINQPAHFIDIVIGHGHGKGHRKTESSNCCKIPAQSIKSVFSPQGVMVSLLSVNAYLEMQPLLGEIAEQVFFSGYQG